MINRTESFRAASATPPLDVDQIEEELEMASGSGGRSRAREGTDRGSVSGVDRTRPVDLEMGQPSLEQFLAKMGDIDRSIQRIARYTEEIEKLHKQVLTAVNAEEAHRLSMAIDELTSKLNDQGNFVRLTLKGIGEENSRLASSISPSDMRIRRTQQSKLAKRFIDLMRKYQEMQNLYKSKYRAQLERQYLIVKPSATREELDRLVSSEGGAVLNQQTMFSVSNKAFAQTQLTQMKERHHEIIAIEKSIEEIHQMFLDMALIVDQQGELIDRVGEHVEHTLEFTQKATTQVEAAVASKRRKQRLKWILTIVGIVLLIIVGVVLWIELGGGGGGGNSSSSHAPAPVQAEEAPAVDPEVVAQATDSTTNIRPRHRQTRGRTRGLN